MRARANLFNHPIHPALIPFPFAFLIGSAAFDLLAFLTGTPAFMRTAGHLAAAGIVTALLAGAAGAVDYVYTVPPRSSAKRRARTHAMFNLGAVGLFAIIWASRGWTEPPTPASSGLQLIAIAALIYGSLQGGTLVIRNMVTVDHRHAHSGKWREITVPERSGTVVVAKKDELKEGQMKLVRAGDRRLVLARTDSGYVAFDDRCTHRGASLADGVLIGGVVQCLWHGSRFDCANGHVIGGPAKQPVATYKVTEQRDEIAITLPGD